MLQWSIFTPLKWTTSTTTTSIHLTILVSDAFGTENISALWTCSHHKTSNYPGLFRSKLIRRRTRSKIYFCEHNFPLFHHFQPLKSWNLIDFIEFPSPLKVPMINRWIFLVLGILIKLLESHFSHQKMESKEWKNELGYCSLLTVKTQLNRR